MVFDGHQQLSEVMKWDLEDIAKANAILDMRQAYDTASSQLQEEKINEQRSERNR